VCLSRRSLNSGNTGRFADSVRAGDAGGDVVKADAVFEGINGGDWVRRPSERPMAGPPDARGELSLRVRLDSRMIQRRNLPGGHVGGQITACVQLSADVLGRSEDAVDG